MSDKVRDKKQILKKVHQLRLDCVPNVMREKVVEQNSELQQKGPIHSVLLSKFVTMSSIQLSFYGTTLIVSTDFHYFQFIHLKSCVLKN